MSQKYNEFSVILLKYGISNKVNQISKYHISYLDDILNGHCLELQ